MSVLDIELLQGAMRAVVDTDEEEVVEDRAYVG